MARRKTTARKTGTTAAKRRTTRKRPARKKSSNSLVNFFVPTFLIGCILLCLGFLLFMGYQTVTASSFFELEKEFGIEILGIKNIQKAEVAKIVRANIYENNVWNADTDAIESEVNKFSYAKEVSISKVLPDRIRVIVKEREPVALIRLDGKDFWFDIDGKKLNRLKDDEDRPPFTMFGWDDDVSGFVSKDNKKRIDLYLKLLEEWKYYDLAKRVKAVDLSDLREPHAIIENLGKTVEIRIEGESYVKGLQKGIESVANSSECYEYVITDGIKTITANCKS